MLLFTVYDALSDSYTPPISSPSAGAMCRTFRDILASSSPSGDSWRAHPEDYTLYLVGEFSASGVVTSRDRLSVCSIAALLPEEA